MDNQTLNQPKKWYKKGWGIALLIFVCLLLALAIALGALAYHYFNLIKNGQGDLLNKQFYGSVTGNDNSAALQKVRLAVETTDDPSLGEQTAPIVIVEFIDFKCPVCKQQNDEIKKLATEYGDQVRLIVRDFPVESTHRGANDLAIFASCANEQKIYWPVHDYFFANQDSLDETLTDEEISDLSGRFSLSQDKIKECISSSRGRLEVNQDYASGLQNGLTRGTPTFFVNGHILAGYIAYDKWQEMIESLQ